MTRPGSIGWFALHEARLAWRDWLSLMTGGHRRSARTVPLGFLVFALVMHGLAYLMLSHYDNPAGTADTQIHRRYAADDLVVDAVAAALKGPLAINDVIYAELMVRFATIEVLETILNDAGVVMEPMPRPALFLAGKALQRYRA